MDLQQAQQTFIEESRELLEAMEHALLGIEHAQDRAESINGIFRAAHTIKGSAGLFNLEAVVAFTHVVESVLDDVRAGTMALDSELVQLLLACGDHISSLIDAVDSGDDAATPALAPAGEVLLAQLRLRLGGGAPTPAPHAAPKQAAAPAAVPAPHGDADGVAADHWHISLRFGPGVLANGMDPLSFIRYLGTLGTVVHVVTLTDTVPALDALDAESCYLGFEIAFKSEADKATIESVFEFVLDDCRLRIVPPRSRIAAYQTLIDEQPDGSRLGEMLVRCGTLTERELAEALKEQAAQIDAAQAQVADAKLPALPVAAIGTLLVEQGSVQPAVIDAALAKQKQAKDAKPQDGQTVRVDAAKLDQLINLVGELITAAASAKLMARRARNVELQEASTNVADLVEQVRDSALQLRMVKIGATFSRFQRVVHDVSRELGKEIDLVIRGEDTELDKTVVEKIGDPLTHLVRNALDHGISEPAHRIANGKPGRGTLTLNAFHDSGSIVIEVSDDGRGLDKDRILAKAVERGLVEAGKQLTDAEIYNLVFEPGFSTAEQVTNLSGRGVGMDVVKRNITAMRGTVQMHSRPGLGTTVSVRLPLTLAIIDGFQVGVGDSVFVVPLDVVDECVAFSTQPGADYIDLRGQVLPFIRLREMFEVAGAPAARENIVVVKNGRERFGLVVDSLLGEAQTVIKPLSKLFAQVKGISGSSIQGSGDVALILDVQALIQHAGRTGSATRGATPELKTTSA